jgi:DCC1-like thiol-disulfide oxidoreductase
MTVQAHVASPMRSPLLPSATSPDGLQAVNQSCGAEYFTVEDSRPVILFDGQCNLCNGGVNFMLDWDKEGIYRYAALQSPAGRALLSRSGRHPGVFCLLRDISSQMTGTPCTLASNAKHNTFGRSAPAVSNCASVAMIALVCR